MAPIEREWLWNEARAWTKDSSWTLRPATSTTRPAPIYGSGHNGSSSTISATDDDHRRLFAACASGLSGIIPAHLGAGGERHPT
jgi:hypothetical protein